MCVTRLVRIEDAEALAELVRVNRDFLAPWDPVRGEEYYTLAGQRLGIEIALREHQQGTAVPHVVLDPSARVVGRVTISRIVRGAFQSCGLGYWVGAAANGRGLATAAVADVRRLAFEQLGLHRIEAGTLLHNLRSQRVLERNGFVRFGTAPGYLRIAGRWQDHALFQALNPAVDP
jgi:ribosomal-protein-alanine N-acetyltransferase